MLKGHITKVEMDSLQEQVGAQDLEFPRRVNDGGIIADPLKRKRMPQLRVFSEVFYQSKLAVFGQLGSSLIAG